MKKKSSKKVFTWRDELSNLDLEKLGEIGAELKVQEEMRSARELAQSQYEELRKLENAVISMEINVDEVLNLLKGINEGYAQRKIDAQYNMWCFSRSFYNYEDAMTAYESSERYLLLTFLRMIVNHAPNLFDDEKLQKKFIITDQASGEIIGEKFTEESKLLYINLYPNYIKFIKNPSAQVQEISTRNSWGNILKIENPDKKILERAAKLFRDQYREELEINSRGIMKRDKKIASYEKEYYQQFIDYFSKYEFNKILKESVTTKLSSYLLLQEIKD